MPAKKSSRSSLYYFVKEKREKGLVTGSFQDAMNQVFEEWKSMSKSEKEPYEKMYKDYKESIKNERMENSANTIKTEYHSEINGSYANSSEINSELSSFFANLLKNLPKSVTDFELIKNQKWYIVKFQTFCRCEDKPSSPSFKSKYYYVLAEVAAIEYSLQNGITNQFHAFIPPNQIPLGYRSLCMESSRDVHKIPLSGFERINLSLEEIYDRLEAFLSPKKENNFYVPVFCMSKDIDETLFGLEFLETNSKRRDTRCLYEKVYDLEYLVMQFALYCNAQISYHSAREIITSTVFDYSSQSRCSYHEEIDVDHCSLSRVKKFAYLISDEFCKSYNIEPTESHLPVQKKVGIVVSSEDYMAKSNKSRYGSYGKRPYENDDERFKEYSCEKISNNRHNPIAVDIRYQQQSQTFKSGSNRRLVALETASTDIDTQSNVSGRINVDDDEGWTILKDNKNKTDFNDNQSVVSVNSDSQFSVANSNFSDSTFRTVNSNRFLGRGRGISKR